MEIIRQRNSVLLKWKTSNCGHFQGEIIFVQRAKSLDFVNNTRRASLRTVWQNGANASPYLVGKAFRSTSGSTGSSMIYEPRKRAARAPGIRRVPGTRGSALQLQRQFIVASIPQRTGNFINCLSRGQRRKNWIACTRPWRRARGYWNGDKWNRKALVRMK